jgi:hypothetical protein
LLASLLVTLDMARGRMSNSLGWPVLACFAAGALQCKVIGILWLAPVLLGALLVSDADAPHERWPGTRAVLVLGGAVAIAAWPYANAWLRTGNPIFPFMNAWFRSPLAEHDDVVHQSDVCHPVAAMEHLRGIDREPPL